MAQTYTYEEAYKASLEYFNNDDLAAKVFVDKYALRDLEDNLLEKTPEDMHWRIAKEFARIEKKKFKNPLSKQEIFDLLDRFKHIICQGSPSFGIGNNYVYQSLGNCFTLSAPYDSYGGILETDQQIVNLCKRRAGIGVCIDTLRPRGLTIQNAARTTDGIGVFMQRFSNSIREVAMQGRRGAGLIGLSVHHPEIETFINIKRDKTKVTGANISVLITDEFLEALRNNQDYEQRWPVDNKNTPTITRMVSAKKIWDQIIDSVHAMAEPGLMFIDNAKKYGTSHCYGKIDEKYEDAISNPCGEVIMSGSQKDGGDSCRLMVLNLYSYVDHPFTKQAQFNFDKFNKHAQIAQRLMDDMVDLEIEKMDSIITKVQSDPEPDYIKASEIRMWETYKKTALESRRTGLGTTGLGDMLASLGFKYGSKESIDFCNDVYKQFAISSMKSSCDIAKEIGPFPIYNPQVEHNHPFLTRLFKESKELKKIHDKYGRRNISLTTVAPCGTISILAQVTSGIEPVFMLEYDRRRKVNPNDKNIKVDFVDQTGDSWEKYSVKHHHLQTWADINEETNIDKSPYWGATSADIDWVASVDLQATVQKWITHSISKTCNVPKNTTKEQVSEIYLRACEVGLKGFTLYRDGCRDGVLLNKETTEKRPKSLPCEVYHVTVQGKQYYILLGLKDDVPYEIFAGKNGALPKEIKTGVIIKKRKGFYKFVANEDPDIEIAPVMGGASDQEHTITRLVSLALRSRTDLNEVLEQLESVQGNHQIFAKAIIKAIKKYVKDGTKVDDNCPNCGTQLIRKEGCRSCTCGFSLCA